MGVSAVTNNINMITNTVWDMSITNNINTVRYKYY